MLLDCYPRPVDLLVPEMSDPILRRMDWILEDARIHALIRKDLAQHYKGTKDGRRPIPVEVTKREGSPWTWASFAASGAAFWALAVPAAPAAKPASAAPCPRNRLRLGRLESIISSP